jgi:hypothetical protein
MAHGGAVKPRARFCVRRKTSGHGPRNLATQPQKTALFQKETGRELHRLGSSWKDLERVTGSVSSPRLHDARNTLFLNDTA